MLRIATHRLSGRWNTLPSHTKPVRGQNLLGHRMFWWSNDDSNSNNGTNKLKQSVEEEEAVAEIVKDVDNKLVAQFGESLPKINPVMITPLIRRPIFPGFFATHLIKDQQTIDAIVANQAKGASYLGLFMRSDNVIDDESKAELITSIDQLHTIGSFAQIHNVIKSPRGAQLMLMVHRRISLDEITQYGPPAIAKVTHLKSPTFTLKSPAIKAYSNEVMGAVRELLKVNPVAQEHIHEWASRMDFSDPFKLADFAASLTSADAEDLQRVLSSLVSPFLLPPLLTADLLRMLKRG
jgi:ATP-dependent Lon protease